MMLDHLVLFQLPLADFLYSFRESNPSGKVIVILLFIGSIYAWTIMATKYAELRRARLASRRFLQIFRKEKDPLAMYARKQQFFDSPLYRVYEEGCKALGQEIEALGHNPDELFMANLSPDAETLSLHQFEGIKNIADRSVSDHNLFLERRMTLLATAVTTSPFLGLLGTVWGVMSAFTGMAAVGTSTLSAVAPGIAAALMTTVMGLLVALPSTIGYNLLSGTISELQVQTTNFAQEFTDKIKSSYLRNH